MHVSLFTYAGNKMKKNPLIFYFSALLINFASHASRMEIVIVIKFHVANVSVVMYVFSSRQLGMQWNKLALNDFQSSRRNFFLMLWFSLATQFI